MELTFSTERQQEEKKSILILRRNLNQHVKSNQKYKISNCISKRREEKSKKKSEKYSHRQWSQEY